jgi:hypothetical protein
VYFFVYFNFCIFLVFSKKLKCFFVFSVESIYPPPATEMSSNGTTNTTFAEKLDALESLIEKNNPAEALMDAERLAKENDSLKKALKVSRLATAAAKRKVKRLQEDALECSPCPFSSEEIKHMILEWHGICRSEIGEEIHDLYKEVKEDIFNYALESMSYGEIGWKEALEEAICEYTRQNDKGEIYADYA